MNVKAIDMAKVMVAADQCTRELKGTYGTVLKVGKERVKCSHCVKSFFKEVATFTLNC
jgi:transposase-like protein